MNLIPSHSRGTRQCNVLVPDASRVRSPEGQLAWNILEQALADAAQLRGSGSKHKRLEQQAAIAYFLESDDDWPFSAINLCEMFGLSINRIRAYLAKVHTGAPQSAPNRKEPHMARLTSSGPQGDVSLKILDKPVSEYTLEEVREITERMRGARALVATTKRTPAPKGVAATPTPKKIAFDPSCVG